MRLARVPWLIFAVALAGCVHDPDQPRWMTKVPFLAPPSGEDAASIDYVVVERPAGGEEINRRVWDRIDEQVVPFEARVMLEEAGLRVGVASESTPGPLRKLIDDPRTARGHRHRSFPADKLAPLTLTDVLPRAEFALRSAYGQPVPFVRDAVTLGFDVSVRDAADGKVQVRFVPRACYRDPARLLPTNLEDREQATETFPAAGFEVTLSTAEFLVIGTDSYWQGTFGHAMLTGEYDDREVQRLLVLRARRPKASRTWPVLQMSGDGAPSAPPLATQASLARGSRP
jgi:hypothetical protein